MSDGFLVISVRWPLKALYRRLKAYRVPLIEYACSTIRLDQFLCYGSDLDVGATSSGGMYIRFLVPGNPNMCREITMP